MSQARKEKSREWVHVPVDPLLFLEYPAVRNVKAVVRNDLWIVQIFEVATELGLMMHLAIRSVQGCNMVNRTGVEPGWKELQRIKDELIGEGREAVQVYPRKTDITDCAEMYHLFVLPEEWALPFGLHRENGFVRD